MKFKKLICGAISAALALSSLSSAAFASSSSDNIVSYSDLDYSASVTVGTPLTGEISATGEYVRTQYWSGNAVAASVSLQEGKTYLFRFTTSNRDGSKLELEPRLFILTPGELTGKDKSFGTDLLGDSDGKLGESTSATVETTLTAEETAVYRLLGVCWFNADAVDYEISVEELIVPTVNVQKLDYEWKTEAIGNDYGYTAIGPNGEIAVCDYDSTYDSDSETYNCYVNVFNPDGTLKFKAPLAYESDCVPVFDENGYLYTGTYTEYVSLDTDADGDGNTDWGDVSYIQCFGPDGSDEGCLTFVNENYGDDYDFWYKLYVVDGVLIAKADKNLVGIDCESREVLWSLNGMSFCDYDAESGYGIKDGKIYLSAYYATVGEEDVSNTIIKVDAATGEIEGYTESLSLTPYSDFAFDKDGNLYFVNYSEDFNGLYKLNTEDMTVSEFSALEIEDLDEYTIPVEVTTVGDEERIVTTNGKNTFFVVSLSDADSAA
ncbi:MAG: hypothetical protein ACI4JX_02475, partial [Oscillospiraceae bacterium]